MANRRLSMRKIKEVLRLKWEKGFSARHIAQSCDIAWSTVKDYLDRAQLQGLTWPVPDDLDDAAVEHMLFFRQPGVVLKWIVLPGSVPP
jgi:hypothetical protein